MYDVDGHAHPRQARGGVVGTNDGGGDDRSRFQTCVSPLGVFLAYHAANSVHTLLHRRPHTRRRAPSKRTTDGNIIKKTTTKIITPANDQCAVWVRCWSVASPPEYSGRTPNDNAERDDSDVDTIGWCACEHHHIVVIVIVVVIDNDDVGISSRAAAVAAAPGCPAFESFAC